MPPSRPRAAPDGQSDQRGPHLVGRVVAEPVDRAGFSAIRSASATPISSTRRSRASGQSCVSSSIVPSGARWTTVCPLSAGRADSVVSNGPTLAGTRPNRATASAAPGRAKSPTRNHGARGGRAAPAARAPAAPAGCPDAPAAAAASAPPAGRRPVAKRRRRRLVAGRPYHPRWSRTQSPVPPGSRRSATRVTPRPGGRCGGAGSGVCSPVSTCWRRRRRHCRPSGRSGARRHRRAGGRHGSRCR